MTDKETIAGLRQALTFVAERLTEIENSFRFANESPGGGIDDTVWMMDGNETLFDAIVSTKEFAAEPQHRFMTGVDPEMGFVLDIANAGEIEAYDQGCREFFAAVDAILDGRDFGGGTNYEPWGKLRTRLIEVVKQAKGNSDVE